MKNPRLKQRKTKCVAGWLTRDDGHGCVLFWQEDRLSACRPIERKHAPCHFISSPGVWVGSDGSSVADMAWAAEEFKKLYTGIPRKGRAVYVQMEIVVE